jgi:dienelactone hydrolase
LCMHRPQKTSRFAHRSGAATEVSVAGRLRRTDASIPLADVEKLRDRLATSTQTWMINIYPGAGPAFFNDTRPSFNAGGRERCLARTARFLQPGT